MNTTDFRNLIANAPAQPMSIVSVTQPKKLLRYHNRQQEIFAWFQRVGMPVKSVSGLQKIKKSDLAMLFLTPHGLTLPEELVEVVMGKGLENPYYGNVICTSKRLGFIGADYESVVNRQRCREAEDGTVPEPFNAESLWGGNGEHVTEDRRGNLLKLKWSDSQCWYLHQASGGWVLFDLVKNKKTSIEEFAARHVVNR